MVHAPFSVLYTLVMAAMSCVPAVVIWVLYSNAAHSCITVVYGAGLSSVVDLSNTLVESYMRYTVRQLDAELFAGEKEMVSQEAFLYALGILNVDPQPNATDIDTQILQRFRGYAQRDWRTVHSAVRYYLTRAFGIQANLTNGWASDIALDQYTGQVELRCQRWVNVSSRLYHINLGINAQSLQQDLQVLLASGHSQNSRIFIFFRNHHGHLITASHGKFHSHSDIDPGSVNLTTLANLSSYQPYTGLNSTDRFIQAVSQQLLQTYGSWAAVPEGGLQVALDGRRFWIGMGFSRSSLPATVVTMVDEELVLGPIEAGGDKVWQDLQGKEDAAVQELASTTTIAGLVAILLGVWLTIHMGILAHRLGRVAQLDFTGPSFPSTICMELYNFQASFLQMERGLRAFAQFVPQAVVTQLVAGQLWPEDPMASQPLTILFADIAGFSTIAETLPPTTLAEVCTEYFEAMCKQVVQSDGTIDKFIGDCIMALWNVPLPKCRHEAAAVSAALAMQEAVQILHCGWAARHLPELKFRLGLHTGRCLVGNFGCSHRVSYTCLGDDVNLASRLEALNKKFGTTICVSQATYDGCHEDFYFRHLSKVTVPGRSEVLSVYEVLCPLVRPPTDVASERAPETPPSPARHNSSRPAQYCSRPAECESVSRMHVAASDHIVYHWALRSATDVLCEAREYEAAYNALAEGRSADCKALLRDPPPDPAWRALADQRERQLTMGSRWDGVFYFREK